MKKTILKSTLLIFCLAAFTSCHHAPKEKAMDCNVSPVEVFGCDLVPQDMQFHSVLDVDFRESHLFDEWMSPETESQNFVCATPDDTAAVAAKASELCQSLGIGAKACWQKITGEDVLELVIINAAPLLDGTSISEASATASAWGDPQLNIVFNDEAAKEWKAITANHIGKRIAITVKDRVLSSPSVYAAIDGGKASVTGLTEDEVCALSLVLNHMKSEK